MFGADEQQQTLNKMMKFAEQIPINNSVNNINGNDNLAHQMLHNMIQAPAAAIENEEQKTVQQRGRRISEQVRNGGAAASSNCRDEQGSGLRRYKLSDILPYIPRDNGNEENDGNQQDQASRAALQESNRIILDGPISKFDVTHRSLVKRYLVLTSFGIFVYEDEQAFQNLQDTPLAIIPLTEILRI